MIKYIYIYNLTFIDTNRSLVRKLEDCVEDLPELNKEDEYKKCAERKRKYTPTCVFDKLVDNRLQYKCVECNNYSYKPLNPIKERFPDTYNFCNGDDKKFVLLLRKGVSIRMYR